ncbi:secreted aspartyl protease [Phycomyces blakesleeanus]
MQSQFNLKSKILCLFGIILFIQASDASQSRILRFPIEKQPSSTYSSSSSSSVHISGSTKSLLKRDSAFLFNDGSEYIIKVSIGTPPQNFTVALDTGSSDLWIPSVDCAKEECNLSRFNPEKSSSFVDTNYPFQINYGLGSAQGYYAKDTVQIGDVVVEGQQFGLASTTKDIITNGGTGSKHPPASLNVYPNGILGLGYPGLTSASGTGLGSYDPFVFNLYKQDLIDEPVFSIFMSHLERSGWTGELLLGGVDHTRHKGELVYVPVSYMETRKTRPEDLLKYWMVTGQSFGVLDYQMNRGSEESGEVILDYDLGKPRNVIIDTGTTMTYVDASLAEKLVDAAVGSGNWSYDADIEMYRVECGVYRLDRAVEIRLSQRAMKLTSTPVVVSVPVRELVIPLGGLKRERARECVFGIAPWIPAKDKQTNNLSGSEMILVGDSILRATYLVFDMGKNQIGFAQAVGTSGSVTGPVLDATLDKEPFGDQSYISSGTSLNNQKNSRTSEFIIYIFVAYFSLFSLFSL